MPQPSGWGGAELRLEDYRLARRQPARRDRALALSWAELKLGPYGMSCGLLEKHTHLVNEHQA